MKRVISVAAAAIPFAFAAIRSISTGWDFRYFWVAGAGLAGAFIAAAMTARATRGRLTRCLLAFVASTLAAALAASSLGTVMGTGMVVVCASFGFWFAVSAALRG